MRFRTHGRLGLVLDLFVLFRRLVCKRAAGSGPPRYNKNDLFDVFNIPNLRKNPVFEFCEDRERSGCQRRNLDRDRLLKNILKFNPNEIDSG